MPPEMMQGNPPPGMEAPDPGMENPADAGGPPQPNGANPFPSTDPAVVSQILAMLGQLRAGDHQNLQSQQDSVLMALLQAMGVGGQGDAGFAEGNMPMNQDPNAIPA